MNTHLCRYFKNYVAHKHHCEHVCTILLQPLNCIIRENKKSVFTFKMVLNFWYEALFIKRIPCVCACVRVLWSVCHAFIKGCTSHWLFLLGLFNVFYDLIAYVLSFDAVISHPGQ